MTRITVNLGREAAEVLDEIARDAGVTKTEVIRRALANERFFTKARKAGEHIILRDDRGKEREVVLA